MSLHSEWPVRHRLILCGWIGLILFSSTGVAGHWADQIRILLFSTAAHSGGSFLLQKSYHVFLFAVLGWLVVSGPFRSAPLPRAILWSFLIGALSETLQLAFVNRGPSVADAILNGLSGTTAAWMWLRWGSAFQKTAPKQVP